MQTNKYKIIYQENGIIKTKYKSIKNLDDESLPENLIDIKKVGFDFNTNLFGQEKISEKDINNRLQELSIMLNSNLLLDDALNILIKNEKKRKMKSFLISLKNSLINTKDIEKSLKSYKINSLVKSFFKITQNSGDVTSNISALSKILNENYEIKKEFLKVMIYPIILFITFFYLLLEYLNLLFLILNQYLKKLI